ncbi:uridine kinase [Legionella qingyii]|uniref:Uridine kinase n=1 Tax=Legionella qingyii TaxID=2184757 RepID=A0A317U3K3_9GAMM|nr:uridine kinase [Legionella qingyii]PWY55838.1 uridine kinase [Legionella qingyii]RUR23067.1 uridine kinase [Legionella qingyii]RUR26913.1 uridine kinase [Legionella qingyii]
MIFIIIGGASGSGKTGLSLHLLEKLKLNGVSAQILNMDDYYRECPEEVNLEEYRRDTNFDTPEMLHLDLLKEHIALLHNGKSVTKPIFDFKTNRRVDEEQVHPSDVIIIEGIFAQYFYKKYWSFKVTVVTANVATDSYADIIERRISRDIEHRGRVRKDCLQQERKYVGPGFLKYTASSSMGADTYVTNDHRDGLDGQNVILDAAADEIIATINKKMEEQQLDGKQETGEDIGAKNTSPNVRELVAKSHLLAGTLFQTRKFEGHFNGVFGDFKGTFVKEFTEKEEEEIIAQYKS